MSFYYPGAPSIFRMLTLGPKVHKCDLRWASWSLRVTFLFVVPSFCCDLVGKSPGQAWRESLFFRQGRRLSGDVGFCRFTVLLVCHGIVAVLRRVMWWARANQEGKQKA